MARDDTTTVLNPVGYPTKVTHKSLAKNLPGSRFDDSEILLKQIQAWFERLGKPHRLCARLKKRNLHESSVKEANCNGRRKSG